MCVLKILSIFLKIKNRSTFQKIGKKKKKWRNNGTHIVCVSYVYVLKFCHKNMKNIFHMLFRDKYNDSINYNRIEISQQLNFK